jgi:hypothetical protein
MKKLLFVAMTVVFVTGCASPAKYNWGGYENSLYQYYKDPTKADELSAALMETIQGAEKTQGTVPPGIYAEYGYLLIQQGKAKEAVPYFEKEKNKWPESTYFMDSMIKTASSNSKNQPGTKK